MTAFEVLEEVTPIFNEEEERIIAAINKIKKFDSKAIEHLEMLGDLAERNIMLFNLGLNFLKKR